MIVLLLLCCYCTLVLLYHHIRKKSCEMYHIHKMYVMNYGTVSYPIQYLPVLAAKTHRLSTVALIALALRVALLYPAPAVNQNHSYTVLALALSPTPPPTHVPRNQRFCDRFLRNLISGDAPLTERIRSNALGASFGRTRGAGGFSGSPSCLRHWQTCRHCPRCPTSPSFQHLLASAAAGSILPARCCFSFHPGAA